MGRIWHPNGPRGKSILLLIFSSYFSKCYETCTKIERNWNRDEGNLHENVTHNVMILNTSNWCENGTQHVIYGNGESATKSAMLRMGPRSLGVFVVLTSSPTWRHLRFRKKIKSLQKSLGGLQIRVHLKKDMKQITFLPCELVKTQLPRITDHFWRKF